MPKKIKEMSGVEYRAARKKLGVSQTKAPDVFGLSPSQAARVNRSGAGHHDPSAPVRKLIRLMVAHNIDPAEVENL